MPPKEERKKKSWPFPVGNSAHSRALNIVRAGPARPGIKKTRVNLGLGPSLGVLAVTQEFSLILCTLCIRTVRYMLYVIL